MLKRISQVNKEVWWEFEYQWGTTFFHEPHLLLTAYGRKRWIYAYKHKTITLWYSYRSSSQVSVTGIDTIDSTLCQKRCSLSSTQDFLLSYAVGKMQLSKASQHQYFLKTVISFVFFLEALCWDSVSQTGLVRSCVQWREVEQHDPQGFLWWGGGILYQAICSEGLAFGPIGRRCISTLYRLKPPPPHSIPCSTSKIELSVENYIADIWFLTACLQVSYHLAPNFVASII